MGFNNKVYNTQTKQYNIKTISYIQYITLNVASVSGDNSKTIEVDLPLSANKIICIGTANINSINVAVSLVNENPTTQINVIARNINDKNASGASICSILCLCF